MGEEAAAYLVSGTKQEIFDRVAVHLRAQGMAARREVYPQCAYRLPDGRRCAIGALLPDGHPGLGEEGERAGSVAGLRKRWPDLFEPHLFDYSGNTPFLVALQRVHDDARLDFLPDMEAGLQRVAHDWNLTYTPPAS